MTRELVRQIHMDALRRLRYILEKEGFSVLKALDGEKALDLVRTKRPDLVVLDLMLPGVKGLDVCRILRGRPETAALPIIMLTARGEEVDKIVGLEMGADDYVTKPFSIRELMARIRTVLRRSALRNEPPAGKVFEARGLRIDYDAYEVTVSGRPVDLGPTELKLLMFLSRNPGRVYSRDQLLDRIWGDEAFVEPRTVDVHVSRLRAAIEADKENPAHVLTVRGVGYKFADLK